ncbi:hypothetical protein Shewmr4_3368 [Shewanella sp. MR-4]|uniref:hypothetical protein n=1 Tax=Shewanella sp. (strain MR-4) TaxID=60480 RepID=UPI00005E5F01|nr:hypothetical protein [Shewanella sp. MR-4]ABI40434.1 hypothetical protein Shewmr4_3368 [Shewanella sp. MR-4]
MNKLLLVTLVSTLASPVMALATPVSAASANQANAQCATLEANHLKAQYQVTNAKGQSWQMTLLRDGQDFIIQRDNTTFEQWAPNGEYVRYFPVEKRSVTYRKGDLRALNIQHDRDQLYHVVSPALPANLAKTEQKQLPCFAAQGFAGKVNGMDSQLDWIASIELPQQFNLGDVLSYQLLNVEPYSHEAFAALTQNYQDIDFADVGDSESDPFIAKMINQGFIEHGSSGFYNSEGHAIEAQGGHGSHSH